MELDKGGARPQGPNPSTKEGVGVGGGSASPPGTQSQCEGVMPGPRV